MNEQIKELIYKIHEPRMSQIVQKIDNCWNDENKAGMLKYINYIEQFVAFIEG